MTQQVTVVDGQIRGILDGLFHRNIFACVNLIAVSYHGIADAPLGERLIRLSGYAPKLDKKVIAI